MPRSATKTLPAATGGFVTVKATVDEPVVVFVVLVVVNCTFCEK